MASKTVILITILLALASGLMATITITVSTHTVYVGESFTYTVTTDCATTASIITVDFGDGTVITQSTTTITGTHAYTTAGVYTIMVDNPPCKEQTSTTMTVNACPALSITTTSLPGGTVGTAYSAQLQAAGGLPPYGWTINGGTLPPGITLDFASGLLNGTPQQEGTYTFNAAVSDTCPTPQTVERSFTITIQPSCPVLTLLTTMLPDGQVGTPYSATIQVSGGLPPLTFSISGGRLPDGLTLDPSGGVITGTPTAEGSFAFTVTVRDSCPTPQEVSGALTIVITPRACDPLVIATSSLPGGIVGTPYMTALTASSGVPPYRWSLLSGGLPVGLTLIPSGEITGTPTEGGTFPITLQVTDSCAHPGPQAASRSYTLTIEPPTVTITAVPPVFSYTKESATSLTFTYTFVESHNLNLTLTSAEIEILAGGSLLQSLSSPLNVILTGGRVTAIDRLTLPAALVQEAFRRGNRSVTLRRTFSDGSNSWQVTMEGFLTGVAGGPFTIRRVDLHFPDERAHVIVPFKEPNLTATAEIFVTGSGMIRGSWWTDERILTTFNTNVTFGGSIKLTSPSLPTFEPGTHTVKIVIEDPQVAFDLPVISYTVQQESRSIRLVAPGKESEIHSASITFRWEASSSLDIFRLEVAQSPDRASLFKALTKEHLYTLSADETRGWPVNTHLFWRVVALDDGGNALVYSAWQSFGYMLLKALENQRLVSVRKEQLASLKEWAHRRGLKIIGESSLALLDETIVFLEAKSPRKMKKAIKKLSNVSGVTAVTANRIFLTLTGKVDYGNYLYSLHDLHFDRLRRRWDGRGVKVAVIDSGVALEHPDLAANIIEHENFIGEAYSEEIHGTSVAGIIAGDGAAGKGYVGIAPKVKILSLRACEEVGSGSLLAACQTWSIARALDYAVRHGATIVNLSIGGKKDPLLERIIDKAYERGVIIIAAAGNNGEKGPVLFPADDAKVIAIGATNESGTLLPDSSRGKVDLAAPGADIFVPVPESSYNFLSGTSIACAHVTGLVALMRQADPAIAPGKVIEILRETAKDEGAPGIDPAYGAGLIQPCRAMERLTGENPCGE